jgi:chromosome segregation ATPase
LGTHRSVRVLGVLNHVILCPFITGASNKRSRTESHGFGGADLSRVVQEQAEEIENLKNEKSSLQAALQELKSENEKVVNENRILKRAVTIQQERQNHAASELEAARRYKVDTDEKMRVLEQMVITLRYHLEAQSSPPFDSFMDTHRPPDVY